MAVLLTSVLMVSGIFLIFTVSVISNIDVDASQQVPIKNEGLYDVISLKPNEQHKKEDNVKFKIYCYNSNSKSLLQIWRSVQLLLERVPLSYEIFSAENESEVYNKYKTKSILHPTSWLIGPDTVIEFPAFSKYCVGIYTADQYVLFLKVRTINYWKLLQTLLGVMLFLSAPSLSRNPFFHYTSGISVGVLASFLVLIYVLSRFIPKKSASYAVLLFGSSFILYIVQIMWRDFNEIVMNNVDIFLAYCIFTAFVSFIVCYRIGPVQNVRTFRIIQWSMQILAVLLIFFGSEYREVSMALIIILISCRLIPLRWTTKCMHTWYYYFPPKVRLLSEMEYIEQGHIETKKALENLRQYCSSPDCNVWKVVSRLKDPVRFAEFVEKGSHCTDEELLQYSYEDFID